MHTKCNIILCYMYKNKITVYLFNFMYKKKKLEKPSLCIMCIR